MDRLPIFAVVGVLKLWHAHGDSVALFSLEGREQVNTPQSLAFPLLTCEIAARFLAESRELTRTAGLRRVREWARSVKES